MDFNLTEISKKIDLITENYVEQENSRYDMFFNKEAKEVSFKRYNDVGEQEIITLPNLAKIKGNFEDWQATVNSRIEESLKPLLGTQVIEYQNIKANNPHNVQTGKLGDKIFLGVTSYEANTVDIYYWDGNQFQPFQIISMPFARPIGLTFFNLNNDLFVFCGGYHDRTIYTGASVLYRLKQGETAFQKHQDIDITSSIQEACFCDTGDAKLLAIGCYYENRGKARGHNVGAEIWKWNGGVFVPHQVLDAGKAQSMGIAFKKTPFGSFLGTGGHHTNTGSYQARGGLWKWNNDQFDFFGKTITVYGTGAVNMDIVGDKLHIFFSSYHNNSWTMPGTDQQFYILGENDTEMHLNPNPLAGTYGNYKTCSFTYKGEHYFFSAKHYYPENASNIGKSGLLKYVGTDEGYYKRIADIPSECLHGSCFIETPTVNLIVTASSNKTDNTAVRIFKI